MRAVALKSGQFHVRDDIPEPQPGFGQVLVQVKACGICGSDLHFAEHGAEMMDLGKQMKGMPSFGESPDLDLDADVFMGHEFAAEVLEVGPDTEGPAAGTIVTSIPILLKGPTPALDAVRHIVEESTIAETDLRLRAELISRILTALDQPSGSATDGEGENHWRSWKTADDERRIAVVPHVEAFCHALTRMVLWPKLQERNRKAGDIMKWVVWYDLSRADVRANEEESARQLWDRGGVSTAYLRQLAGANNDDAPSADDYVRQLGWIMKNPILATYGLEGVDVDWDRAAAWGKTPGPSPDSPADEQEVGPGTGDPGSPNPADRDSDNPTSKEPE